MRELQETAERPKRALLVSVRKAGTPDDSSLAGELAGLADTLGLEIAGQETVRVRENQPHYGMGSGKAEELAEKARTLGVDCVVFDQDLSPSKQRNWEALSGVSVLDRRELIIQIFSSRARTREAELQVSLAELVYALPRLSHKYIDLSRQRGGRYGTKGSGETRLETDRRQIEERMGRLRLELTEVRRQRELQRKKREKAALPVCALVGYTNAGKSSLFNALCALFGDDSQSRGAPVLVEDKLFATLDPTTRRIDRPGRRPILLADTVGFIRRLPHELVDAFRATLEEAVQADLLIHVLDAADPNIDAYYAATMEVLDHLGAGKKPMIVVLNKVDLVARSGPALRARYPGWAEESLAVSARDGSGLPALLEKIEGAFEAPLLSFRFPPERHDLVALLHRSGNVLSETYPGDAILVEARPDRQTAEKLRDYLV
ncbi:MAG: GTPase HflX [Treponema sp.]|jgi:GTP-binding protein HflX|nr:GTPase HflX [Treponema sp.]